MVRSVTVGPLTPRRVIASSITWPRLVTVITWLCLLMTLASSQFINHQGIVARQSTDRYGLKLVEVWEEGRLTQAVVSAAGEVLACETSLRPTSAADRDQEQQGHLASRRDQKQEEHSGGHGDQEQQSLVGHRVQKQQGHLAGHRDQEQEAVSGHRDQEQQNLAGRRVQKQQGHLARHRDQEQQSLAGNRVHKQQGHLAGHRDQEQEAVSEHRDQEQQNLAGRRVQKQQGHLARHRDQEQQAVAGHRDQEQQNLAGRRVQKQQGHLARHRDQEQQAVAGHRDLEQLSLAGHRDQEQQSLDDQEHQAPLPARHRDHHQALTGHPVQEQQALAGHPLQEEQTPLAGHPDQTPSLRNSTIVPGDRPAEDLDWLASLRKDCGRLTEQIVSRNRRSTSKRKTRHGRNKTDKMRKKTRRKNRNHLAKGRTGRWTENLITPGTHWCGPGNTARRYSDLGPASPRADRCCREHDQCSRYILGLSRRHAHTNFNPFTLSHCTCDRSLRLGRPDGTPLRLPGTMWCGRGYSATSYKQLGAFSAADRCCRRHDTACPRYVPAMSFRWGIYNWRPSTLMHCHCDRR